MTLLKSLPGFLLPLTLGYIIVRMMFQTKPIKPIFGLAIAYWLGTGVLTQWMLVLGVLGIRFRFSTIGIPLVLAICFLLLMIFKTRRCVPSPVMQRNEKSGGFDLIFVLLALFVVLEVSFVFWFGLNCPPIGWDDLSTHAFNAKVIFFERSIALQRNFPHYSYPLHVPFLQAWLCIARGQWDDQVIQYIFPLTLLTFLIGQYECLSHLTNRRWAMFGLALLLSANFLTYHATLGYRDFTLMSFNCWVLILFIFWYREQNDAWLYLAALASGFASFTKLEGVGYILIHGVLLSFLIYQRKAWHGKEGWKKLMKFLLPCGTIAAFYILYKYFAITSKLSDSGMHDDFNLSHIDFGFSHEYLLRIPVVLKRFSENLFVSGNWSMIWFILLISFLNPRGVKSWAVKFLLLGLLLYFGVYFLGYTFTQHYLWILGETTLSRTILQFFPLATMLIVLLNYPQDQSPTKSS